jgi:putative ABC transport system permease protein
MKFDYDKWEEIFESLGRHKLRTFLTALAVWWGIFMLVLLVGLSNGLRNSFERDFSRGAKNALFMWGDRTSMPYNGLKPGRQVAFDMRDYETLINDTEGVEIVSGRFNFWGDYSVTRNNKSFNYNVQAVHPSIKNIQFTKLDKGRFINNNDIDNTRKAIVVGHQIISDLFEEDEEPIGEFIKIKGTEYMIVGISEKGERDWENRNIFLPITTAQRIHAGRDRVHSFALTVDATTIEEVEAIEATIRSKMATNHQFDPKDIQAIGMWNKLERYQEFQMIFTGMQGFTWFVGIGSIIAGMIGVSNIMLIVVKDRTREIGVRKALGATPRDIISMIVTEAIFLTSIAGYLGLLMGFGLITALSYIQETQELDLDYFYNPEVDFGAVMTALIVLVISGALSGLIPAIQAVKINPVVAMKS